MTDQQKEDSIAAEYVATQILPPEDAAVILRIVSGLQTKDEQLTCIRKKLTESLPKLDEAFRRYGCDRTLCGTKKCPNAWPCQAFGIMVVANEIRSCLGEEES